MASKKIGVIGSGPVGQALAKGFSTVGYEVRIGSRSPDKLKSWITETGGQISAGTFDKVAAFGDLIVLATHGEATENVIEQSGLKNFSSKILIDVTNPLDFSKGMPPDILS